MASIAPPRPARPKPGRPPGGGGPHDDGRGGFWGARGAPDRRYYTGMMVGLAGITMLFTAFTSAYVVRKGLSNDWRPLQIPPLAWLNSILLLAGSYTIEQAKRWFVNARRFRRWWLSTTVLGLMFLVGQILVWQRLTASGVYLNTNPSSSFFYVLTASHGIHLLGGVIALMWLTWKLQHGRLRPASVGVMALYWHFMDGLWIYLLMLIFFWR